MELTEGSETSANHNLTPGKYPKEHAQYSKHGESLKSRISTISLLPNKVQYKLSPRKTRVTYGDFDSF
jgi:hypothetical protein